MGIGTHVFRRCETVWYGTGTVRRYWYLRWVFLFIFKSCCTSRVRYGIVRYYSNVWFFFNNIFCENKILMNAYFIYLHSCKINFYDSDSTVLVHYNSKGICTVRYRTVLLIPIKQDKILYCTVPVLWNETVVDAKTYVREFLRIWCCCMVLPYYVRTYQYSFRKISSVPYRYGTVLSKKLWRSFTFFLEQKNVFSNKIKETSTLLIRFILLQWRI